MSVIITDCGKMRAGSVHVRHAIVEVQRVNVVIGVVLGVLHVVRVVPIVVCDDAVVFTHLFLIAILLVAIFHVCFAVLEV